MRNLGKLIRSNSHTDFVCQIYGPSEIEALPASADHAFGTFVHIPLGETANELIGLIYDTQLFNPDFGNLGPRLSPAPDLAVFSPDYLAEKVTLVGITAVGTVAPDGTATHGVAPLSAPMASFGRLVEASKGKDTIAGHWEIMGIILEKPFPVFSQGFPKQLVDAFIEAAGLEGILGNVAASGTKIIQELGDEHLHTGYPILYTSADSVFQIAAHEEVLPPERL